MINLRVPKDVGEEEEEAYLRFTPVPAVPDPDTQEPRRPKESLDSFDLDLNLANTVEVRKVQSQVEAVSGFMPPGGLRSCGREARLRRANAKPSAHSTTCQ